MTVLYFDCFSGIAGDMATAALLSLTGAEKELRKALKGVSLSGYRLSVERGQSCGMAGTRVHVNVSSRAKHGRHLRDIVSLLASSCLPRETLARAIRCFELLGAAEAKVHGTTIDEVHFHEVGAVDAIVDIVGTALCLEMLGWPKVVSSPMPTFHGFAEGAHGTFPLPAPATAELLRGVPWRKLDIEGELVTPTGAAIIREISASFGNLPAMTIETIGYGAGKSDFGILNALRVMIGEETALPFSTTESVAVIETNIDDLNPEFYELAMERIFAAGALDVFLSPIQMKKNRPGTLLTVICNPEKTQTIAEIVLADTSTFGVRISGRERICLDRRWAEVETPFGKIRIKIGRRSGRETVASPEYEDCKRAAMEHGAPLRRVYDAALAAYHTGQASSDGNLPDSTT